MLDNSNIGFAWTIRAVGFIVLPLLCFSCVVIKSRLPPRKTNFFLPSAFKVVLFDIILGAQFCLQIAMFAPLIYLPTYALIQGMDTALASYVLSMLNGASIFGRILPGFLSDKFGRLNLLFAAGITTAILVFCWPRVVGTPGVIVFSVIFGFCSGAIISGGSVALLMSATDPKTVGTFMGQGMGLASFSVLLGPPVTGAMLDTYGGFVQISVFAGVFALAGSALVLIAKTRTSEGLFGRV
jgi:predicted MFS family arabinose efflux permease